MMDHVYFLYAIPNDVIMQNIHSVGVCVRRKLCI